LPWGALALSLINLNLFIDVRKRQGNLSSSLNPIKNIPLLYFWLIANFGENRKNRKHLLKGKAWYNFVQPKELVGGQWNSMLFE
jgi:hypothetical protein